MVLFVLILLMALGTALVSALYSGFFGFYHTYRDVMDYNMSYYGAISGIERGVLMTKYKYPGFEGTGGWLGSTEYGASSDKKPTSFSIFTKDKNGILRTIASRTTQIPKPGFGNIEFMFVDPGNSSYDSSRNYNIMDYQNAETFLFTIDTTSTDYTIGNQTPSSVKVISGSFRLPPKIYTAFGGPKLASSMTDCGGAVGDRCDAGGDKIPDDAIVDRSLRGSFGGVPYIVMPYQSVDYRVIPRIIGRDDSLIRESKINGPSTPIPYHLNFASNKNPFAGQSIFTDPKNQIILSENESNIVNETFSSILGGSTDASIRFSLLNLLQATDGRIYPFLEYKFDFRDSSNALTQVADRFYAIRGVGKVGEYEVNIVVKKPTSKDSVLGSFTIIL